MAGRGDPTMERRSKAPAGISLRTVSDYRVPAVRASRHLWRQASATAGERCALLGETAAERTRHQPQLRQQIRIPASNPIHQARGAPVRRNIPLPRGWKRRVKSTVLQVLALSHYAFTALLARSARAAPRAGGAIQRNTG